MIGFLMGNFLIMENHAGICECNVEQREHCNERLSVPNARMSELPPNFQVGQSNKDRDCFFDSVAQGLRQLKPELNFTAKSLRLDCKSFAQSQLEDERSWLKEALKEKKEQINEYISRIEFSVNDFDQKSEPSNVLGLTSPIWGRSDIEGRIICAQHKVKLHVIEKRMTEGEEVWTHHIVDSARSLSVDASDYNNDESTIHVISTIDLHFIPVLRIKADQQNIQLSPDPEYNKPTYQKRPRTDGIHGNLYEIELSMLLLLLAEAKEKAKTINSFSLATNMQGVGDFDDLVLKYKYSENGKEKSNIIFMQAKHREGKRGKTITDETLFPPSDKGDFLLRKYLSSYIKITDPDYKTNPLFQEDINNNNFIIYTNASFDKKLEQEDDLLKKEELKPEDGLLFVKNSKKYYYQLNANQKVKDFLRHSLDFEILVKELAQSVYSGSIPSSKDIFKDYQVSLANTVIKISEKNKEESKLRQSFLNGKQNEELSCAFLNEIKKNKKFSKYSESELREELSKKIIKLHHNFGHSQDNDLNLTLPKMTIPEKIIEQFLKDLKLFVNQPNVKGTENAIKEMIKSVLDIKENDDANLIYFDVHSKITNWWRQQNNVEYFTESNKLFNNAIQNLSNTHLVGLALLYDKRIKSLELNFKSDQIKRLSNLIQEKRILRIISDGDATLLSAVKVYQALEGMSEYKSAGDNYKYIFVGLTSAHELRNNVVESFRSEKRNLLVIECEETNINCTELCTQLADIVKGDSRKKLVFITREKEPFANQIKSYFSEDSQYHEKIDRHNTLADLDDKSQAIIRQKQVLFQGIELELSTLLDEESKYLITADVLSKLINGQGIEVDKTLGDLEEVEDYYIDRKFHRRVNIKKECFEDNSINDLFVVSNVKDTKFFLLTNGEKVRQFADIDPDKENPIRFITLDDNGNVQEKLKRLYKTYPTSTIHWVKKEGDKFIWQESQGSLSNLREFVNTEDISEYPADKITNVEDRIVIVSAEPGMGKSVLLTKLAGKEKVADPSLWVVRLNLNEHTKELKKMNLDEINLNGTINFLSEIMYFKTPLEKELFKHRVEHQGKVVLLFDGFDEISPHYKEKVIALAKILIETKVDKLWITTRPHMRNELEDKLSVLSYSLKPLSTEDQKHFLRKFWARKLNLKDDINDNGLNTYIEELLKVWSLSIADEERDFTGIPLQTRMLAEVYEDKVKEFFSSDQTIPNFPNKLDLLDLYQSFIDKKYEIYWLEKNKADTTIPIMKKNYEDNRSKFMLEHQLLALEILFSSQEVGSLLSARKQVLLKKFKRDVLQGNENTGIISLNLNGTPNFIHRTFAEYFAALWLADSLDKKEVKTLFSSKLLENKNRVLHNFFDRILASDKNKKYNYEIHNAVLNNDIKKVEELSSSSPNYEVDKGGRTALHLAAAYGFWEIAELLLKNDSTSIHMKDQILDWRPLRYADKGSHWHVAELLLQRGAIDDDMYNAKSSINSMHGHDETLLYTAAEQGFLKLAEYLVHQKANIHAKAFYSNNTPLHSAAKKGHLNIVKLLIEEGADFNCHDKDGYTALHVAAMQGHLDLVKFFIEKGADLKCQDKNGCTALHLAARQGHLDIVKFLIQKGADFNCPTKLGLTVLHYAAFLGHLNVVKFIIQEGADFKCPDADGSTVLHVAAMQGHLDLVKFLIQKGADLKCQDKNGRTGLHVAAKHGQLDVVKFLIQEGADFECQDKHDRTVLHFAANDGHLDVVKFLIEQGADLKSQDKDGSTVLNFAANSGNSDLVKFLQKKEVDFNCKNKKGSTVPPFAAFSGKLDLVKFLIEKGADFKYQEHNRSTGLHVAAKHGQLDVVKFLIQEGADFECLDKEGCTALHSAAKMGHFDVVKLLIHGGADFECLDKEGCTALHSAAKMGHFDVVKLLIHGGADFECLDKEGCTALHLAAKKGHGDIVKFLIQEGADFKRQDKNGSTVLHLAGKNGHVDIVKFLIQEGADLKSQDKEECTVLHIAAKHGHLNVVKFLIQEGTDFKCRDKSGYTVLHLAGKNGHLDIVKFLIQEGVHLRSQDKWSTVLHLAALHGYLHVVQFLVQEGADVNCLDKLGLTVLHHAAFSGHLNVVKFLIEQGADFKCPDAEGTTALHLAATQGHLHLVKFLIEKGADLKSQAIDGRTVLHSAAKHGQLNVVKFLIQKGADFECQDKDGRTVLHFAAHDGHLDVVKFLIEQGADVNCQDKKGGAALFMACKEGHLNVVKFLIEKGADFISKGNYGNTILHLAAYSGNLDLVKFLVQEGADVKCRDFYGSTVLHFSTNSGNLDLVKFLIEKGADFMCQDNSGRTALHWMAKHGHLDVVKFLVQEGADFKCLDKEGCTALHLAAKKGHFDVVKFLIQKGA